MSLRPADGLPAQSEGSTEPLTSAASAAPDPLDAAFDEFDFADLLESHAELVLNLTETIEQLENALESRKEIGQALGVCMERYGITEDQAFTFLVRISQDQNVKLRDVAKHLVERTSGPDGAEGDAASA